MDEDVVVGHWLIEDGSMDEGVVSDWRMDERMRGWKTDKDVVSGFHLADE